MQFDSETQTLSLILQMKKKSGLRVISMNGTGARPAQLKIDLFDPSLIPASRKIK
jgi:hypothetical protein